MSKRQPTTVINFHYSPGTPLLPDGRPLPDVCTAEEVMQYLRLADPTTGKCRARSLENLRERRILIGYKSGRYVRFKRQAVLDCLQQLEREVV